MPTINRKMVCLNLRDGTTTIDYVMVPCTLERQLCAINDLNKGAYLYGAVYLPDPGCEEYQAFVRDSLKGI